MSTTIDQKVVEMRFDNRLFENNVKESMSTLDKLKQKLNLSGASKGLENLNSSANKVNMSGLSNALEVVHSKFSALEVMGVTALANITNSAVNAGKRMVSALTIDPIKTGLSEYETQINSVQTILANTQKEGTNVQIVNKALDELNKYADMTIYNFTEMTRNIGTFTAAGVKLDTSVNAIKGIANLAAVSGSTSQQASTAMYQLSQALASGTVKLMDWNSVVNAGMGGQVFQDALKETARLHGVAIDEMIENEGSFRDTLQNGWLSADILTETLEKFTYSAKEGTEEWDKLKSSLMEKGYTEQQAIEILKLGNSANEAATKVKTFTQLWDVLKEAAQSGWSQTWRIIIGDFDEAKSLFTPLSDFLTGVINGFSEARNKLLEGALGKKFTSVFDNIKKSADSVKKVVKTVEDYATVVDGIIGGKWGNGQQRWDKLTEAGYDWAHAQNLVNEKLGCTVRHTTNYKEAQKESAKTQEKVNETTTDYLVSLSKLSDSELEAALGGKKQAESFREIQKAADKTGIPLKDFIENIDEIDGRFLLINSFKNIGLSLVSVFKSIGKAWKNAFPPMSSDTLFNIIAGFHKFTAVIRDKVEKNADSLTRTLKGLFAIIDLISMVVGGGLKIAFTILKTVLGAFNMNILDFTALIGDGIVKVRDWIEQNNLLVKGIEKIAQFIVAAVRSIKNWIAKNETITKGIETFKSKLDSIKDSLKDWIKGLKETDNIPKYILQGLVNGLKNGASVVFEAMGNLGKGLLEAIKGVLGIHSPSTEFFEIGKNIMQGLFNGISGFVKMVYSLVMAVGGKLIDIVKNLDIGSIFTITMGAGSIFAFVKIAKAIDVLTGPLESLDHLLFQAGEAVKAFKGLLKTLKLKIIAESVKTFAVAIAILAGSVIALTLVDPLKMWSAVGAIVVLMGVLAGLTAIAGKFGGDKGLEFGKLALTLIGLGIAMALMAKALKTIAGINSDQALQAIGGFVVIIGSMVGMMAVVSKNKSGFAKLGSAFLGMATALLIMSLVVKTLGKMDRDVLIQGGLAIVAFSLIIIGLMAATKLLTGSKNVDKIGKSISKIASAILIMMVVAKIAGKMDRDELIQGGLAIVAFGGIIVGLMAATKLISGSTNVGKIGGAIFGIAGALLMMVLVAKIAAAMNPADLAKGTAAVVAFGGIIVGLMAATKLIGGSKNVSKIGKTILMFSVSIGLMAITAALLSLIDLNGLAKGIVAVGLLSAMIGGLVFVTKYAKNVTGTIGVLTASIAVLALSLAGLSMIKPERLASASAALGIVLGMFALVVKASGSVKKAMGTIIVLTVAIGVLAGALYFLAQLPADRAMASSVALSLLLGVMGGVMALLSAVGGASGQALLGVLGMVALCVPLYAIVDVLSRMQNVKNASANATALGTFMGVLAVVQILCAAAGAIYTATGGMAMLGLLGMAGLIATLYLLMGALAIMSNIENAIANLNALTSFIKTLTVVLVALAIVGPLALIGVKALTSLVGVMAAIGVLAVGIGYLMQHIPSLQGFLSTGISVLVQLADGIGRIIGAFISGAITQISSGLPTIGTNLSQFMINATPFIVGAKTIDSSVTNGIKALAESILIITGANLLESLTSWLTGGNSLADFGAQLGGLGASLKTFVTNLGTFDEAQVTTVDCAGRAIKALATAAGEIPNEGGLWAKIAGENSLVKFGSYLPGLATHLNQFVTNLGTFSEAQVTTVDCAGRAIKSLAESANEIPNEGGLWGAICGDNSLAKFGSKLPALGTHLNQFVSNLGTFSDAQVTTVNCAGSAIKALAKAAETIPNEGGLWAKIVGDNSLAKFGSKLPGLAKHISGFVKNLGTFSEAQVATINSACKAIKTIAKLGEINISDTSDGLITFGSRMVSFSRKVKSFVENISEVDGGSIDSAINKTNDLVSMAKSAAGVNVESLQTFGNSLKKVAKDGVKGFVKEFSGETPKEEAKKATRAMLDAAINGAEDKKSAVKSKFKSIAREAVDSMSTTSLISGAKQAGKDLVSGFANGIRNNMYLSTNAGSALGRAALNAAKEAIKSHSPSREAMKIGNYFGQGLVIGIKDYEANSYKAGYSIADNAKEGLGRAITKVSDLISTGIDSQPTIRPVLDLSDVESGAGYLNTMFNDGPSIGVMSNLNAISHSMDVRRQNGANDDIVSALDKLRKDLGNVGGDTYNVNGVTYDDGSNIAGTVKALTRAIKMERRT